MKHPNTHAVFMYLKREELLEILKHCDIEVIKTKIRYSGIKADIDKRYIIKKDGNKLGKKKYEYYVSAYIEYYILNLTINRITKM